MKKPAAGVGLLLDAAAKSRAAGYPPDAARLADAERKLNEALALSQKLQDARGESLALMGLGAVSASAGKSAAAEDFYRRAAAVCRENGDPEAQGDALFACADLLKSSRPDAAIAALRQAAALFRGQGIDAKEMRALAAVGAVLEGEKQPDEALQRYKEVLDLARAVGEEHAEADALLSIGRLVWRRSLDGPNPATTEARYYYGKASDIFARLNDRENEALTAQLLGGVELADGDMRAAEGHYGRSITLYRDLAQPARTGELLAELSEIAGIRSDQAAVLRYELEALALSRKSGDRSAEALALRRIGDAYSALGQNRAALDYYHTALTRYQPADVSAAHIDTLTRFADLESAVGGLPAALSHYRQAERLLETALATPSSSLTPQAARSILARVYLATGSLAKARALLEQRLAEARKAGLQWQVFQSLSQLGLVEHELGARDQALARYAEALPIADVLGYRAGRAQTLAAMGGIEEQQGRLASAEQHLRQAVALYEGVGGKAGWPRGSGPGGQTGPTGELERSARDVRGAHVRLLLRLHRPAEAFDVAQKMKARALLDLMERGGIHLAVSLTPEERDKERDLRARADLLGFQLGRETGASDAGTPQRVERTRADLSAAERDLQAYQDALYGRHRMLAQMRGARTRTLAEIAAFLPSDTALLEYVSIGAVPSPLGVPPVSPRWKGAAPLRRARPAQRGRGATTASGPGRHASIEAGPAPQTILFIVTHGSHAPVLTVRLLKASGPALDRAVEAARAACSDPRLPYRPATIALFADLVAPAAPLVARMARLIICPDGPLWGAPFAALPAPALKATPGPARRGASETFLTDRYELAFAASATCAAAVFARQAALRNRLPDNNMLVLADPAFSSLDSLPGTRAEAVAIRSAFRDFTLLSGPAAQESTFKRIASRYRYLHFATHGFFNDAAPLLSTIALAAPDRKSADDGFLTAREIFDLDLNADMAVVSACGSVRGEKRTGEGILGLTWALFAAGVPTQVVSQWPVDIGSTAPLMRAFYANIIRRHMGKAQALREAALELRTDRRRDALPPAVAAQGGTRGAAVGPGTRGFVAGPFGPVSRPVPGGALLPGGRARAAPRAARFAPGAAGRFPRPRYAHPYYWAPFILLGDWR